MIRMDIKRRLTPKHELPTICKNRYNILEAVTIKWGDIKPVDFVNLQQIYLSSVNLLESCLCKKYCGQLCHTCQR